MASKRKVQDTLRSGETEEDLVMGTTTPRKKKTVTAPRQSPTSQALLSSDRNLLMERKLSLYQQATEQLNESFQAGMKDADNQAALEVFYNACEYLRIQREINELYHRTPGQVVAMGSDDCYQLGQAKSSDDDKELEYKPIFARSLTSNIIQVAAGGLHSVALGEDGAIYSWGCNDDFAMGRPEIDADDSHKIVEIDQTQFEPKDQGQMVAIDAGDSHTLFMSIHGNVYQVGMYKDMDSGKWRDLPRGETNPKGMNETAVKVHMPQKVKKIIAGSSWNAAILADDTMVTWGMGHSGQLARSREQGAPPAKTEDGKDTFDCGKMFIGEEYDVQEFNKKKQEMEMVTYYRYHTKLIAEKFLIPRPPQWATPGKRRVISVACGDIHLLVVARDEGQFDSRVYSAGHNQYGQLGHGDQTPRHELTPIKQFDEDQISKVSAGATHSLALTIGGDAVWSWGRADYGQCGLSAEPPATGSFVSTPTQVAFPDTLVIGDTRITDIVAGPIVSMITTQDGDVYSWGFNEMCATGHGGDNDILRPKKLNVLRQYAKKNYPGSCCDVHNISGGGQHTLMVVERFDSK